MEPIYTGSNSINGSEGLNYTPAGDENFGGEVNSPIDFYLDCDPRIQTCPEPQMTALVTLGAAALFGGLYDASINDYQSARRKLTEAKRLEQQIKDILGTEEELQPEKVENIRRLGQEMMKLLDEAFRAAEFLHSVNIDAAIPRVGLLLFRSEALLLTAKNDLFLAERGIHPDGHALLASATDIVTAVSHAETLLRQLLRKYTTPLDQFALRQLLVKAIQLELNAWEEVARREAERPIEAIDANFTTDRITEVRGALQQATEDSKITDELKTEVAYTFILNSFSNPAQRQALLYAIYQLGLAESEEEVLTKLSSGDTRFKNSLAEFGIAEPTYLLLADKAHRIQAEKGEAMLSDGLSALKHGKASEAAQKLAEARDFLQRNLIIGPSILRASANHAAALVDYANALSKERKQGRGSGQIVAAYEAAMEEAGELAKTDPAGVLSATYKDAGGKDVRLMNLYAKAATENHALTPDPSAVGAANILGARDAFLFELRHVSEKELATVEGSSWLKRCLQSLVADWELLVDERALVELLHNGRFDHILEKYLAQADIEAIKTKAEETWLEMSFGDKRGGSRRDDRKKEGSGAESPFKK